MKDAKFQEYDNTGKTSSSKSNSGATPEQLRDIITRLRSGALNLDSLIAEVEPLASAEETPRANDDFGAIDPHSNS